MHTSVEHLGVVSAVPCIHEAVSLNLVSKARHLYEGFLFSLAVTDVIMIYMFSSFFFN